MFRVLDLEVENREWFGEKASLHNPDNYIVEAGWLDIPAGQAPDFAKVQTHRNNSLEESYDTSWFNLDGVRVLVVHNASYEVHCLLCRHREVFEEFLQGGGRIYDTAWAEYLLSDYQELYPALNEVAPKYGGTQKVDGIKILWDQGHLTSEIDPELLHEYLAGPEGDVVNTARVFLGQYPLLVEREQVALLWERMQANLALAYCEFFGMHVDAELAGELKGAVEVDLAAAQQELSGLLPDDLPEEFEFSWASLYHVSALLFGGSCPYKLQVPYDPPRMEKADFYRIESTGEFVLVDEWDAWAAEFDTRIVQEGLERTRFVRGKRRGEIKVFREDTDVEATKIGEALYEFKPLIPIPGLPAVLREKFDKEWQGKLSQRCGTPVYSTKEEVTDALAAHGWGAATTMQRRAALAKELGSFYLREERNAAGEVTKVTGMLQYVQPDSIVHHRLNTMATVTGRLSSSNPNLQQLPRGSSQDKGSTGQVKRIFTSRFGDEGVILQSDYSSLEVVCLAAMSADPTLLQVLADGTDMHCLRLAGVLGEPYEDVYHKCHTKEHPDYARYRDMREDTKPRAFSYQYGARARGIAFASGCSIEEAQAFQEAEDKLFAVALAYRDVVREEVERTGELQGNTHREQGPDGRWRLFRRGYFTTPSKSRYSFRQHLSWDSEARRETMQYRPTQMANYWCQGESFLIMAVAMGRILFDLLQRNFYNGKALLVNNVHDAVYLDVHRSVAKEVGERVKFLMEDTPRYMDEVLGTNLGYVAFPADCTWGASMQDEHNLETLA